MKEPQQYEVTSTGLRTTQAWKDWRRAEDYAKRNAEKKKKRPSIGRRVPINPEEHYHQWKEIAWVCGTERRIMFCCCQSGTGRPFDGCGAVGIQTTRGSKIQIVVESRFE